MAIIEEFRRDFGFEHPIMWDGDSWQLHIGPLGTPFGVATKLRQPFSEDNFTMQIWIDWFDIINDSDKARINIFNYSDLSQDSFNIAMQRTKFVLQGIQIYDNIMKPQEESYTKLQIEEMLRNGNLPRPKTIYMDGDRPLLKKFFEAGGFLQTGERYFGAYDVSWDELVLRAQGGYFPLVYWKDFQDSNRSSL